MKIVIVDDDCLVTGALKTILEVNEDVDVVATGLDGRDAVRLYGEYKPDVLLMDEPFGHLDAQTRYMMQESLGKIWENERRTIVFVTNNIEEALYLADRIILLTDCPSQIKKEYHITLPRPRSLVSPEFLRLRKEITEQMNTSD